MFGCGEQDSDEMIFSKRPGEEKYRQRMVRLREEKGLIKVKQRKLAHQGLTEFKSYRFTTVELVEINTRTC